MNSKIICNRCLFSATILFWMLMSGCGQSEQFKTDITGLSWHWEYDDDGQLTEIKTPGNIVTHFSDSEQESNGELVKTMKTGSEKRSFKWNLQGQLLNVEGPEDKTVFVHNTAGLPIEIRSDDAPTLYYDYDLQGRLTGTRIGNVANIGYRYDYLGRPATIVTPAGDITYDYHRSENMVLRRLPNGIQSAWKYDNEGKLASLTHLDKENYIIAKYVYSYRPDNLIKTIKETNQRSGEQTCRYEYDLMQRLSSVDCGKRTYAYRYDSLGNLIESEANDAQTLHFTNTPAGAIESDSRGVSETDQRGHIRKLPHAPIPIDYEFNDSGMLVAASNESLQYSYNALGLLKTRSIQGEKTSYLADPFADAWHPLWRRNSDGTEDVIIWDGAAPLVEVRGKEIHYRLEDHLGSVRIETNRRGKITAWQDYSPYGMPENAEPNNNLIPAFTGHFWDPVAKTYLTKARAYDPITARFLQPDPKLRIPDASKHNHSLYVYAGGDPVNFVDRNGAEATYYSTPSLSALAADMRMQQQDMMQRQQRMASEIRMRQQEMMQRQQQMASKIRIRQERMRWQQQNMLDRVRRQTEGVGRRQLEGTNRLSFNILNALGRSYITTAASITPIITLSTGGLAGKGTDFVAGVVTNFVNEKILQSSTPGLRYSLKNAQSGTNQFIELISNIMKASNIVKNPSWNAMFKGVYNYSSEKWMGKTVEISALSKSSPVGGVYLGGAGKTLEGMGQIKGISIDETTGKLVLIGSGEQQISLPPLRLDDIVTIFRAVYDHGQSPSVTIDPDEENPQGPTMDVKHGPGTEGTYVGWILFECDRIMKSYQLGQDNVSKEAMVSKIAGYKDMLDAVYFGGDVKVAESQGLLSRLFGIRNEPGQNWERFWIVPASVSRFDSEAGDLSLFELPLKVNTQKMHWKGGKLVDDEDGKSSFGANKFTSWFTNHYDEIADEVLLTPPPDSGLKAPVAIFHELRRIAVITAIAERLRDFGEIMPTWMRDYSVAPFPVSKTTPSLTVEKSKEDGMMIRTASIYGGVNLAPADQDVYHYSSRQRAGSTPIPSEHVTFVNTSKQDASSLKLTIPKLNYGQKSVGEVQTIKAQGTRAMSAVILPGSNTRALAPNRQQVTDVVVPMGLGRSIKLTRYYNSFFNPVGELGAGWTFNLPQLLMTKVPVKRDGKRSKYRVVPHLISPLGTMDIRFDQIARVEPYNVKMSVAEEHPEIAGVASGYNKIIGTKTHQVLFRDGTEWHFDDHGRLLLIQDEGIATRYVRNLDGQIDEIKGYIGSNSVAEIKLSYNQQGRVITAKTQQADYLSMQDPAKVFELEFKYGVGGRLSTVINQGTSKNDAPRIKWNYSYAAEHLASITDSDGAKVSFGYDAHGQLLWEKQDSLKMEYLLKATAQGTVLTKALEGGIQSTQKWTYNMSMRPVEAEIGGDKLIRWQYGQGKEVSESLYQRNKLILTHSTSQDGKKKTTTLTDGPTYEVRRNTLGHPTQLLVDGVLAADVSWHSNGRLAGVRTANTEIQPRRNKEGWQNGVLISAPMVSGKTNNWLEYEWDLMGRPIKMTDSSGFNYVMNYNDKGQIDTFGRLTNDGKLIGTNLNYNEDGLITDIDLPWGTEERKYTDNGVLKRIETERHGKESIVTFDVYGRPKSYSAFDGGKIAWNYASDEAEAMLQAVKLPNGAQIDYLRNDSDEAPSTDITFGSTVVRMLSDAESRVTRMTWGKRVH